jgi:hypothetical protein
MDANIFIGQGLVRVFNTHENLMDILLTRLRLILYVHLYSYIYNNRTDYC